MQSRFVFNTLDKEVKIKIHGAWFVFKPKQIKQMNEDKVDFIAHSGHTLGLVTLSNDFEEIEHRTSEAGKAELAAAAKRGRQARYEYCQRIFLNQTVSLKKELEGTGVDYRSFLNPELEALFDELAAFKRSEVQTNDKNTKKMDDLEKLMK